MKLSKNFYASEFDCPCCGDSKMDPRFIEMLQSVRNKIKRPIYPTSGWRCDKHNATIKGASKDSMHIHGTAVDIYAPDAEFRYLLVEAAFQVGFTGIGVYKAHVHLDMREGTYGVIWGR